MGLGPWGRGHSWGLECLIGEQQEAGSASARKTVPWPWQLLAWTAAAGVEREPQLSNLSPTAALWWPSLQKRQLAKQKRGLQSPNVSIWKWVERVNLDQERKTGMTPEPQIPQGGFKYKTYFPIPSLCRATDSFSQSSVPSEMFIWMSHCYFKLCDVLSHSHYPSPPPSQPCSLPPTTS